MILMIQCGPKVKFHLTVTHKIRRAGELSVIQTRLSQLVKEDPMITWDYFAGSIMVIPVFILVIYLQDNDVSFLIRALIAAVVYAFLQHLYMKVIRSKLV